MPLHKSRLPNKDESTDPTTPPPTPVSDSEMTFDSDRAPHLSPEVKNLLDYLRNSPDFEASPMSHVVYYYLPGETDSSDSSPPSPVPSRLSEQRGAGPSYSNDSIRSTGSQQARGIPASRNCQRSGFSLPPRDGRAANGRIEDRALCRACPIHCPPPNENNIGDDTLRTTGLREYLRSLLRTRPTTTSQDSPSSAQRATRPIITGPSCPSSSRQKHLKRRRRQEMDEWEFSFLDPEYDSESDTTPSDTSAISPPSLHLPVRLPPFITASSSSVTTPRQRNRAASRISSPNLAPSRSSLTPLHFSPLVDPRIESRSSRNGSLQEPPPRSAMPTSPSPQHTSPPLHASTVLQIAPPSFTPSIHPPMSVPRTMTIQPESQPLSRGAPAPTPAPPAPAIHSLLAHHPAGLATLDITTSSRSSPDLFSPNRERTRIPLRRQEPSTSPPPYRSTSRADAVFSLALATTTTTTPSSSGATMEVLAPPASPGIVPAEVNQTASGETDVVGEGPSSAAGNGRVTVTVVNLSTTRTRRRGEVQVLRSARIRNMQAKREADTAQAAKKKRR